MEATGGLALALSDPLVAGEFPQAHGAAGVQLVSADGHLRAEAELTAVVEPRARVDEDNGGVDLVGEAGGCGIVLGHDGLGVAGAMLLDVLDSLVDGVDHANGHSEGEEFPAEVLGVGGTHGAALVGPGGADEGEGALVAAEFDAGLGELGGRSGQQGRRDGRVDEEGVEGVADVGALRLGVEHDIAGLPGVGRGVDVDVNDADAAGDGGDGRVFANVLDEGLAAARDEEVEVLVEPDHLVDDGAVRIGYELDGFGSDSGVCGGLA